MIHVLVWVKFIVTLHFVKTFFRAKTPTNINFIMNLCLLFYVQVCDIKWFVKNQTSVVLDLLVSNSNWICCWNTTIYIKLCSNLIARTPLFAWLIVLELPPLVPLVLTILTLLGWSFTYTMSNEGGCKVTLNQFKGSKVKVKYM